MSAALLGFSWYAAGIRCHSAAALVWHTNLQQYSGKTLNLMVHRNQLKEQLALAVLLIVL